MMKTEITLDRIKEYCKPTLKFHPTWISNMLLPCTDYAEIYIDKPDEIERLKENLLSPDELKEKNLLSEEIVLYVHFKHNTDDFDRMHIVVQELWDGGYEDIEIDIELTKDEKSNIIEKSLELIHIQRNKAV